MGERQAALTGNVRSTSRKDHTEQDLSRCANVGGFLGYFYIFRGMIFPTSSHVLDYLRTPTIANQPKHLYTTTQRTPTHIPVPIFVGDGRAIPINPNFVTTQSRGIESALRCRSIWRRKTLPVRGVHSPAVAFPGEAIKAGAWGKENEPPQKTR